MAIFTGRDTYEDYTYDDEMQDEYYDDEEESEMSLTESLSSWMKKIPRPFKKSDRDEIEDEEYEYDDMDEEYEDEDEEELRNKKRRTARPGKAAAKNRYDEDYEPQRKSSQRKSGTSEYTREDYESYDRKYGTSGSYVRAEQSERNRARVFAGKKDKRRTADGGKVTKLYDEEKYKGNVKGVLKFAPKNIDDTNDIADSIMDQYAVLIDLKGMSKGEILRILDFIDGVAYVLKYSFDEISKEIYMCAPKGYLKNFNGSRYTND